MKANAVCQLLILHDIVDRGMPERNLQLPRIITKTTDQAANCLVLPVSASLAQRQSAIPESFACRAWYR